MSSDVNFQGMKGASFWACMQERSADVHQTWDPLQVSKTLVRDLAMVGEMGRNLVRFV